MAKLTIPFAGSLELDEATQKAAERQIRDFQRFCLKLKTTEGKPLKVEPFQRLILLAYFAGYPELLVLIPKKNGKTVLLAALACYHLMTVPDAEAYIGASSTAQARKMYGEAARFGQQVGLMPFPGYLEIRVSKREQFGVLRVLASDKFSTGEEGSGALEGIGPTLGLVDELHAHKNNALYAAIHGGLPARDGQMVTISTAGGDEDTPLGNIRRNALALPSVTREEALTIARGQDFAMFEWSLTADEDVEDLDVVKRANPATFQTKHKLGRLRRSPAMTPTRWRRYHCNIWTQVEGAWLEAGEWADCHEEGLSLPPPDGEIVYLGVDFGRYHDCAAISYIWPREGRPPAVWSRIWRPDQGTVVPYRVVEEAIREACRRWQVPGVGYDSHRLERSAEILAEEHGVPMVQVSMSPSTWIPLTAELLQAVKGKEIAHDGDPRLAGHVNAGELKEVEGGQRLHGRTKKKVDALIALGIAWWTMNHADARESVYESKELLVL